MAPSPEAAARAPRLDDDWRGRRVTVCGLGLFGGGVAVARALARRGARVTVTDLRSEDALAPALAELAPELAGSGCEPLALVLGRHREDDFARADVVVVNPAVPPASPFLALARAAGVPLSSEIALVLASTRARLALVTGTQGKSSVTQMTADLARAAGLRARAAGNIGRPLIEVAADLDPDELVVLELSSYQLESLPPPASFAAAPPRVEALAITNVLADHLERHGELAAYLAAKLRILELAAPGARVLVPAEDERLLAAVRAPLVALPRHASEAERGLFVDAQGHFRLDHERLGRAEDLRLPGRFQRENALCALGLARVLGAAPEALARALPTLTGLPHRLEELGSFAGRRVIDNGVSTTPDSTIGVLDSVPADTTLVCGGRAKRLALEPLARAARGRLRRVIAFGESRQALLEAFAAEGLEAHAAATLEEAVALAFARTRAGETLLFSPACASFDGFANFRARAERFRALVAEQARGASPLAQGAQG